MPEEIGPELRFREDDDIGGDPVDHFFHDREEVEGKIHKCRGLGDQLARHGLARLRAGGKDDTGLGELPPQGGNDGGRRRDLTYGDGMDPDPRMALESGNHIVGHGPQLLPDALTVLSRHKDLECVIRRQEQEAQESGDVVKYVKHRPTIMRFQYTVKFALSIFQAWRVNGRIRVMRFLYGKRRMAKG